MQLITCVHVRQCTPFLHWCWQRGLARLSGQAALSRLVAMWEQGQRPQCNSPTRTWLRYPRRSRGDVFTLRRVAHRIAQQCAIGLSGVIFGLIVVDNCMTGATSRSIFGFFYVPAHLYPWTLLVLWQVIMPGVSFLGHLCGVLVRPPCAFAARASGQRSGP